MTYPSFSVTETLISAIQALDGPTPTSFSLGELLHDFDVALEDFVEGGGGGGGGSDTVKHFNVTFGPSYASGVALFIPVPTQWQRDWWIEPTVANNGLTPKLDIGFFTGGGTEGLLTSVGAEPMAMNVVDIPVPQNSGFNYNTTSLSWSSSLQTLGFTTGPPVIRQQLPYNNMLGQSLFVVISQDGTTNTPTAATLTAQVAPTSLTITHNSNDQFIFNGVDPVGGGGALAQESFRIPAATYANLGDLGANGVAKAVGTVNPVFGDQVIVSNDGTHLILSMNPTSAIAGNFPGAASNGCFLSAGFHDALANLGFTGANVFRGGLGGDPGATAGAATTFFDIAIPA